MNQVVRMANFGNIIGNLIKDFNIVKVDGINIGDKIANCEEAEWACYINEISLVSEKFENFVGHEANFGQEVRALVESVENSSHLATNLKLAEIKIKKYWQ